MDPSRGHCNGTRYIVCQVSLRCITAEIACGEYSGNILFIPRIPLTLSPTDADLPFTLRRRQFPSDQRLPWRSTRFKVRHCSVLEFCWMKQFLPTDSCTSRRRVVGIPATSDFCTEWSHCKRHLHRSVVMLILIQVCGMYCTLLLYSVQRSVVNELPVAALYDVQR